MHLHGYLAYAELTRDLFVHQARRDEADDLLFARRQGLEMGTHVANRLVLGAPRAVAFERNLNRIEEVLIAKRLVEELDGSGLHGPHGHRDIAVAGDENDRNANIGFGEFGLKVEPA